MLSRIDVKETYRQIPADPEGAPDFYYRVRNLAEVDPRLKFGWRNRPGRWGLFSAALERAHTRAVVSPQGASAVDHVPVAPPRGGKGRGTGAAAVLYDCARSQGVGGEAGRAVSVWCLCYVDDSILVEAQWFQGDRRCKHALQSLSTDHYRLSGERSPGDANACGRWDAAIRRGV